MTPMPVLLGTRWVVAYVPRGDTRWRFHLCRDRDHAARAAARLARRQARPQEHR